MATLCAGIPNTALRTNRQPPAGEAIARHAGTFPALLYPASACRPADKCNHHADGEGHEEPFRNAAKFFAISHSSCMSRSNACRNEISGLTAVRRRIDCFIVPMTASLGDQHSGALGCWAGAALTRTQGATHCAGCAKIGSSFALGSARSDLASGRWRQRRQQLGILLDVSEAPAEPVSLRND